MTRTIPLALLLFVTAFAAGCQVSLWAGDLEDPYELNFPKREVTPTPFPTPAP